MCLKEKTKEMINGMLLNENKIGRTHENVAIGLLIIKDRQRQKTAPTTKDAQNCGNSDSRMIDLIGIDASVDTSIASPIENDSFA